MHCSFCGAVNKDGAPYCVRCASLLCGGAPVGAGMLQPVQGAQAGVLAPLLMGRSSGLSALRLGEASLLRPVVAGVGASGQVPASPRATWLTPTLLWRVGGLLLCTVLLFGAQQVLHHVAPEWHDWTPAHLSRVVADMANVATDTPAIDVSASEPDAVPALSPQDLAHAINAELLRLDVKTVSVQLAQDRVATVVGQVGSPADRLAVLDWVASVPGVASVVDKLVLDAPPEDAQGAPERHVPEVDLGPRAGPAPASSPTRSPAISPADSHASPAAPLPSAEAIEHAVARELSRLALPDVAVEVDPASLQVTLRGTATDAAHKAQALSAARAASPNGRVRDLVFLIEE
jgi:BON domain